MGGLGEDRKSDNAVITEIVNVYQKTTAGVKA